MASAKDRGGSLWGRLFSQEPAPQPTSAASEAARLRELAEEKRRAEAEAGRERDRERQAIAAKWREGREKLAPRAAPLAQMEILRRARVAAERGETAITVDLGVNEDRLRASSTLKELALAEAVLAHEPGPRQAWDYIDRIGWLLQAPDGQGLSEHGEALLAALQEQGFSILFLPYFVQDNHAEPFVNARFEIQW